MRSTLVNTSLVALCLASTASSLVLAGPRPMGRNLRHREWLANARQQAQAVVEKRAEGPQINEDEREKRLVSDLNVPALGEGSDILKEIPVVSGGELPKLPEFEGRDVEELFKRLLSELKNTPVVGSGSQLSESIPIVGEGKASKLPNIGTRDDLADEEGLLSILREIPVIDDSKRSESIPIVGEGKAAKHPGIGQRSESIPIVGEGKASKHPGIGQRSESIPIVGEGKASLPGIGQRSESIPIVGEGKASLPGIGQRSQSIPIVGEGKATKHPGIGERSESIPIVGEGKVFHQPGSGTRDVDEHNSEEKSVQKRGINNHLLGIIRSGKHIRKGMMTFYYGGMLDAPACGGSAPNDHSMAVAVHPSLKSFCNGKVRLQKGNKVVYAVIRDWCPTCAPGTQIDATRGVFQHFGTLDEGEIHDLKISYLRPDVNGDLPIGPIPHWSQMFENAVNYVFEHS